MKERDVRRFIAEYGGKVVSLTCNTHWKAVCQFGDKSAIIVFSATASDHRADVKRRSFMKRKLREWTLEK
jgi:galactokinase/mevalonate kinase-like predicted kinase